MLNSPDKTYWTAPALLASIVELDIGIIVGCMPVIQVILIRRFAKISQLSPFRCLTKRLFRARSKASTGGAVENGPDLTEIGNGRPYLETEILHGADGEGNFMSGVAGTLLSDQRSLVTNYVSSAGSSQIDQAEDPDRYYTVHVQAIENVV